MDNYTECLWIVEQLYRNESMSFRELAKQWAASSLYDGRELSNSTFRRRKNEIAERININITYDPACNIYKIANAASSSTPINISKAITGDNCLSGLLFA